MKGRHLGRPGWISGETVPGGQSSGLAAIRGAEFGQDVLDVGLDGTRGDEEGFGDLLVRQAPGQQREDLPLARGQTEGSIMGCWSG